jgi:hypothetical protein
MSRRPLVVRLPAAPTCTATVSTGSLLGALLSGHLPPGSPLVWPLVVLALGSMAYDLGVRAMGGSAEAADEESSSAGGATR